MNPSHAFPFNFVLIFLAASLSMSVANESCRASDEAEKNIVTFSMTVDFGVDIGQSFGSLFEARDRQGRVVAGAGFADVYNTRFRSERHTLQFFVRSGIDADEFRVEPLPHPDLDCGVYLFDLDKKLYAWTSVRNNSVRRWDETAKRWLAELPLETTGIRSGDGVIRVGVGTLTFDGGAKYNDRTILTPPTQGDFYSFYYAQGFLFFYHRQSEPSNSFTKIYACPWTPEVDGPIDLSKATVFKTKYEAETPFAWGQHKDEVLTVSNQGGVYVFGGGRWRTILEADNTVSYQVYSMMNYHDRLLLAQYPTGELFEYDGDDLQRLEGWPPRLPGVSSAAREAQTMAIYRGDLFVGVWPWAEVWRYDRDAQRWHSMGRMFTHPELTDKQTHPYEEEAKRHGLVANHWGQRATGMIPLGDSLMISTSSKGTSEWSDKYEFLTEQQRREYGAVHRLRMPGNVAAQIQWKNEPTKLEFVVLRDEMIIRQDGRQIGSSKLGIKTPESLKNLKVNWGEGVYGPLRGKSVGSESR